jgi:hypothetical protein
MASIKLRRGSGVPSGLTFGEPAFDITNSRLYVGVTGGSALVGVAGGGVHSFNGLTGAVTGVTTGTANTFGPLQSFTNGISSAGGTLSAQLRLLAGLCSSGGTFSGTQTFTNGATFSGLATFNSGISATGGITFGAPISSIRLPRFTSAAFETKVADFTPSNADNGKVFLVNHTSKTPVTVTLDNLNIGWRAKFIAINSGAMSFSSSFGSVYGAYGADGSNTQPSLLDPIVEVICYDTNLYFAG